MAVCRKSPRTHFGTPVHVGQLHVDNATAFSYITANNSGSACITDDPPGLRYNEETLTWQFSNNGTTYVDFGIGGGSISGSFDVEKISENGETVIYYPPTQEEYFGKI